MYNAQKHLYIIEEILNDKASWFCVVRYFCIVSDATPVNLIILKILTVFLKRYD